MIILGISGKLKSGKDTVASYIEEALKLWDIPLKYVRVGYADALYAEVATALVVVETKGVINLPVSTQLVDAKIKWIKEHKDNFRLILQGWGTEYRRKMCGEDYWVIKLFHKLTELSDDSFVVIPDVRFENELTLLLKVGVVWRVVRGQDTVDHSSETELDSVTNWRITIRNESSLADLRLDIQSHLHDLLKSKGYLK